MRDRKKRFERWRTASRFTLIGCVVVVFCNIATAGDWPQILGPARNGHASDESLPDRWSAEGPELLWSRPVGRGFAGAAVKGDRAILFHRIDEQEIVEAVKVTNGETIWRQSYKAHMVGKIFSNEDGPLCVPLIHGSQVFVYGGGGDLRALELQTGKKQWERSLYKEFRTRAGQVDYGYFGAGSTPIVEDDRVLVNVGGFDGAGIMALSTVNGETIWEATDERPSYSAPVATTIDGVRHVVFVTRYNGISINPKDGKVHFQFPFGKRGPTVNAASPLIVENQMFTTASYGVGARLTRINRQASEEVWESNEAISSQYNTPVYHEGYLYGTNGRADREPASLRCVELQTGRVAWSVKHFGVAAAIVADNKLLIVKADGVLVLAEPSSEGFKELARVILMDGTVRALPALAEGRLFVRDEKVMSCFSVGTSE